MLTLMREYQAAIDAALAAERAGDPLRAHDRAIAMDALGEVITTLLTALDALPAMRGSLDQSIQEWHIHAKNVATLAPLRERID